MDSKDVQKGRPARSNKKWSNADTTKILEYILEHENLEKPTAQIYYRKLLAATHISSSWDLVRFKLRHLRNVYHRANAWLQSKEATTMAVTIGPRSVEARITKMCYHYNLLKAIFGGTVNNTEEEDTNDNSSNSNSQLEFIDATNDTKMEIVNEASTDSNSLTLSFGEPHSSANEEAANNSANDRPSLSQTQLESFDTTVDAKIEIVDDDSFDINTYILETTLPLGIKRKPNRAAALTKQRTSDRAAVLATKRVPDRTAVLATRSATENLGGAEQCTPDKVPALATQHAPENPVGAPALVTKRTVEEKAAVVLESCNPKSCITSTTKQEEPPQNLHCTLIERKLKFAELQVQLEEEKMRKYFAIQHRKLQLEEEKLKMELEFQKQELDLKKMQIQLEERIAMYEIEQKYKNAP